MAVTEQAVLAALRTVDDPELHRSIVDLEMVKDLRTQVETSDTVSVLDGDLDRFMAASLAQRVGATRADGQP